MYKSFKPLLTTLLTYVIVSAFACLSLNVVTLLKSQDTLILRPTPLPQHHVFYFDTPFEEITLDPIPGVHLSAIHFKTENPKGVVLYFHGQGGNTQFWWGYLAKDFLDNGYDVIMPDYRTFGKSYGTLTFEALLEDADLFYEYTANRFGEDHIIAYGRSLGTGFATYVASRHNPSQLILESPYSSIVDVSHSTKAYIPRWLLAFSAKYPFDNQLHIQKVRCPILIFHGIHDEKIPYTQSEVLTKTAAMHNTHVRLITLHDSNHNSVSYQAAYRDELARTLQ